MLNLKYAVLLAVLLLASCVSDRVEQAAEVKPVTSETEKIQLQFLTRDGCSNTTRMLENLKQAISSGLVSAEYVLIDQGTLPADDPRTGYPTPTVLMHGRDIFDLAVPKQPFPEPS